MFKKTLLGALLAAGSLIGVPTVGNAQYAAIVRIGPPAPLHEVVPPARSGFVWAPGHYEWHGSQYVWIQGHWMPQRYGYEYREPRWVQRGNGEWHMVGGNWERRGPYGDRDRDGIPNAWDGRPNGDGHAHQGRRFGPYGDLDRDGIINRDDRDRDGDGVANRRDRFPDDPQRS